MVSCLDLRHLSHYTKFTIVDLVSKSVVLLFSGILTSRHRRRASPPIRWKVHRPTRRDSGNGESVLVKAMRTGDPTARTNIVYRITRSTKGARTCGIGSGEIHRGFIRPRQLPYKRPFGRVFDTGHLRELLA